MPVHEAKHVTATHVDMSNHGRTWRGLYLKPRQDATQGGAGSWSTLKHGAIHALVVYHEKPPRRAARIQNDIAMLAIVNDSLTSGNSSLAFA